MIEYRKWNDPMSYNCKGEEWRVPASFAAKEGDEVHYLPVGKNPLQSKKKSMLDQADCTIAETVATFKYLTMEQLEYLLKMRGFYLTRDCYLNKLQKLSHHRLIRGFQISNQADGTAMLCYQIDYKGVPFVKNRGLLFHSGNRYISNEKRKREGIPLESPDEIKRILMGNQILLGMLHCNVKMRRFGIMETFRAVTEEWTNNDGMVRTTVNVNVDAETVLALEVIRDTPDAPERLADKVRRYYMLIHQQELDYLASNFHGDTVYPQLILCGETLEHNRKMKQYLEEEGLWREEDPILFTEDELHVGNALQTIYSLEADGELCWYCLPENPITYHLLKKGA